MFAVARRNLSAAAAKPSVDRLQMTQLGMARRLLNPQFYELHDDDVSDDTPWEHTQHQVVVVVV